MSQSINAIRDGQEMADPVTSILLRFPGPVTLRASRKKWAFVLFGLLVLVVGCVYGLQFEQNPRYQTSFYKIVFWTCVGMGSVGIPMAAAILVLPSASRLVLDQNGFEIVQLFRSHRVRWTDATGFQVSSINPGRGELSIVVFDDAKQKGSNVALLNKSLAGRTSGMPDTYGLSAENLVDLMNQWRERATK